MKYNNVLEAIGRTPLIRLNKINPYPAVEMYAKMEGFNPTGSIKDRIALKMIEQAEAEGTLNEHKIILEATSGNTGIGLAMIGAVKGYRVHIVMSEAVSVERRTMIQAFGAQVILTPAAQGTDGAIKKAQALMEESPRDYFMPDQYSNHYNKMAHYKTTAVEIWEDTRGKVTHFVSSLGTSGTMMGVGMGLKEKNPAIQIVEAHPEKGHYIQGLKNLEEAIVPDLYDPSKLDQSVLVQSEQAMEMVRNIVLQEGLFVGMSSGAALIAGLETAKHLKKGLMVIMFPDRGEKYLSTDLFA